MTTARPNTLARQAPILDRLSNEWNRLTIRIADLRWVRTWGLPGTEIRTLDDVLVRCGYRPELATAARPDWQGATVARPDSVGTLAAHDQYVLQVLAIAQHDQLAARIVLQRILPLLAAVARRHACTVAAQHDLLDDLVSNSWASICAYPIDRRPDRVIPNLVRDIGFQTIVRPARRRHASEVPMPHERLSDSEYVVALDPLEELVTLLDDARRRGVSQADVDLLCQLVTMDRPENLAAVLNVSPRTVRNHRDAALHRLRAVAAVAA